MSSTELFRKHFGEESAIVDLKHPNIENFFDELNKECLKEDGRTEGRFGTMQNTRFILFESDR